MPAVKYPIDLHIVLHNPEIPPNTGNVGRTCLAIGAKLWLVKPLGFRTDVKQLRRAGLDYWQHLEWEVADDWESLLVRLAQEVAASGRILEGAPSEDGQSGSHENACRLWLFTKTASRLYTEPRYQRGDVLVFGSESRGLPPSLLAAHPQRLLRIPIRSEVRSLNLSAAVAVAAYEAVRQWG